MKYSIVYAIHDYGYFILVHFTADSIGSSTAEEIANLFEKQKLLLSETEQNVFKITFREKTDLHRHSTMSIISNDTGDRCDEACESLKYEVMNKIKC
jgi:hypothetical protein